MKIKFLSLCLVLILCLSFSSLAGAQARRDGIEPNSTSGSTRISTAYERSQAAAGIFRDIMEESERGIPENIMEQADAIAVFPSLYRFGPVFTGGSGSGLVSIRNPQTGRWCAPIFITITGGTYGKDAENGNLDLILIGLGCNATEKFLNSTFGFGINADEGSLDVRAETAGGSSNQFLAYARNNDRLFGLTVENASIFRDRILNQTVYGEENNNRRLILPVSGPAPGRVMAFPNALDHYYAGPNKV